MRWEFCVPVFRPDCKLSRAVSVLRETRRLRRERSARPLGFGHLLAIKLPSLLSDEAWNSAVLRHRADKVLLTPVPEQVVGVHRRPPAHVAYCYATGRFATE